MDREVALRLGWYKELNGKDERRRRYQILRKAGLPAGLARRIRDWSKGHIELFLRANPHMIEGDVDEILSALFDGEGSAI